MTLIRKPFELDVQTTIKALLYGQPGIGKSTLALSTPSPLMLDFDGGIHRVNPAHQTDTVQVRKWEDVIEVLKEDLSSYKTLVIDTAGKMLDYMSAFIIQQDPKMGRKDGALTLQGYGVRKAMFVNFLKQVSIMGKHLVFVAHDREEKEGDSKIIRPEIGGSSAGDLIRELDLVGYMEALGKKRTISFDPCEKFYGKNTCNLSTVIEIPSAENAVNNLFTQIIDKYVDNLSKRKDIAVNYNSLMGLIQENIDSIKDAQTADQFVEWFKGIEVIWDSKLQAANLLKIKASGLNLKYDSTAKRYVQSAPVQNQNVTSPAPANNTASKKTTTGKQKKENSVQESLGI